MSGTPPTEQGNTLRRLQRATTGRLQRWDTRLAREDGTGENGVDSSGMARRIHLARTETRGRLQRHTTQRLPVGADQSESAPPVVITEQSAGGCAFEVGVGVPDVNATVEARAAFIL